MVQKTIVVGTALAVSFLAAAGIAFAQSASPSASPLVSPAASPMVSPSPSSSPTVPSGAPATGRG